MWFSVPYNRRYHSSRKAALQKFENSPVSSALWVKHPQLPLALVLTGLQPLSSLCWPLRMELPELEADRHTREGKAGEMASNLPKLKGHSSH